MAWENVKEVPESLEEPQRLSVLIVEDEAPIRETLREFFIGKDFVVQVATNGAQAGDLLAGEHAFDLVVSDLRLPIGSGVEILKQARERNPDGYVVLMTGFASLESAIDAVRLGAFDYLVKPFSLGELDLTLERVVEHRALARENEHLTGELERLRPLKEQDRNHEELKHAIEDLGAAVTRQSKLLEKLLLGSRPDALEDGAWSGRKNLTDPSAR